MIRLAVRVRRDQAELVLAELLELAPGGVEEVEIGDGVVEYAVYGAPGELPALPDLEASAGGALVEVVTTEIADDWSQRWREFHRPVVIGDRLTVRPPWEPAGTSSIDLVIDPGQAFGTGAHATTRLCLEMLLELPAAGGVVRRSGLRLGRARDRGRASWATRRCWRSTTIRQACRPRRQRGRQRGRSRGAALRPAHRGRAGGRDGDGEPAGAAVACLGAAAGRSRGRVPARLIASGLLVAEADGIAEAFAAAGLREADRRESGEWGALLLERG